jgi:hypothetical protein
MMTKGKSSFTLAPRYIQSWSSRVPRPAPRVRYWGSLFVHEQLAGSLQAFGQPVDHRLQMERGLAHPIGQNSPVQINASPRQDLALTI